MQRQTVIRSVPQWHAKIRVYFGHLDTAVCAKHVFNIGPPNQPCWLRVAHGTSERRTLKMEKNKVDNNEINKNFLMDFLILQHAPSKNAKSGVQSESLLSGCVRYNE